MRTALWTALVSAALMGALPSLAAGSPPQGADFEQALPQASPVAERAGDGHAGEGPVTHRSPVIEAPRAFDVAGLADEMRAYELRGRATGGDWTDWAETANGDPVWFGGMDQIQVRTRGYRPSGSIHYVDVSGTTTAAKAARGGSGIPAIVTRRQWGANQKEGGCEPRKDAEYGKVKAASVHHTVSAVDYAESQAPGMVLAICRFHRNSNGWNDIGYNALVDRFGNIYAGRNGGLGRAVLGAHAQGFNAQTSGVAVLGTHTTQRISKAAMRGLARWLAWKLPTHGHDTTGKARMVSAGGSSSRYPAGERVKTSRIIGHRRTGLTECPGDALYKQLGKLRTKVQRRINAAGGGGGGIGSRPVSGT